MSRFYPWAHVGPLLLAAAALGVGAAPPHRVLVLHSFGRGIEPFDTLSAAFRSTLIEDSPEPIEFHEISLETALFSGAESETPFVEYLAAFDAERRLDLVVAIGGPATRFVQRNRARLFTSTPLLIAGVDVRLVAQQDLTPLDAEVAVRLDVPGVFRNVFSVLPETREVAVVLGKSPLEQFWVGELRRDFEPFSTRARLTFYDDLPLREILKRAAALPEGTAIFYFMFALDAEGAPHVGDAALLALRTASSAPLFALFDSQLGTGIVGGPMISLHEVGRRAALAAERILHGEPPSRVRPAPIEPGAPTFDWRELARFEIDPGRLPPASVIRFRPPSYWKANPGTILGIVLVSVVELALILVLLTSLTGRRRAEEGLRRSREQFALAVEGANDGIWDWNVLTGEVYYSKRCKALLGHEDDEVPNAVASWEDRIHPEDRKRVMAAVQSHLDGRTEAFRVEHRLRHSDGSYRWILARGKAQRDSLGKPYRMAGSLSDITELKLAEDGIRDVSRRLIVAQEEERARLARELHDDVTQRLARLAIDAGRVEPMLTDPSSAETMGHLRAGLVRLSEDVHALSYRLHPSLLEDLGLADALQVECDRFRSGSSLPAELLVRDLPGSIPRSAAICLFRVAQEALRNVDRHARARSVEVSLRGLDGGLQLAVRDDGIGFDPAFARTRPSLGHASMRERIHLLSGEIDIESAPGHGTTIVAWIPLHEGRV